MKTKIAALSIVVISILVWWFWPRHDPQLDYNVRVGEASPNLDAETDDGERGYIQLNLPDIGPYEATGYGEPPPNWKPVQFKLEKRVPAKSRLVVTGTIEVEGGDSAPLTVLCIITKAINKKTPSEKSESVDSCNLTFSKPKTIEHKGTYNISDRAPEKPGTYIIHIADPRIFQSKDKEIIYAQAEFQVVAAKSP